MTVPHFSACSSYRPQRLKSSFGVSAGGVVMMVGGSRLMCWPLSVLFGVGSIVGFIAPSVYGRPDDIMTFALGWALKTNYMSSV